jgi:uncharacterized membrane protein YoaK (UPF0700 family)
MPNPPDTPADRAARFAAAGADISVAVPLTLAGGALDAFAYVGHGHVFANAMTGNVALLGVALAAGDWAQALRHVPPLLAFTAAVFLVHVLQLPALRRRLPLLGLTCLSVEIGFLAAAAWAGTALPDAVLIPAIAFAATLQTTSFDRLDAWPYTSVMTTGNLRHFAQAALAGCIPRRDPAAQRQARLFGAICLCFLAGAGAGALATLRLPAWALLVPLALLAAALLRLLALAGRHPAVTAAAADG